MATTITNSAATDIVVGALTRAGCAQDNAAAVARALVAAEHIGQIGHGLRRLAAYCAQVRSGKVDGRARPSMTTVKPGTIAIDAANGFAFPALELAVDHLPALATSQGIAAAGIRRSHHSGVAGLPVEALANRGLLAIMVGNSPAAIAPWGGRRPLFGTNPIAFAAPLPDSPPIVVDTSLSKVARGKIMAAKQKGEAIPEGWALDRDGAPTTDPAAALAGTMVPMGGAKGTALVLMVELLCAGLTGANYSYDATSFFDDKGPPPGVGQTLIAIDPAAFGSGALDRFATLAGVIEAEPGARLPGRRRQKMAARMAREGISVDNQLLADIIALADGSSAA